jgi:hypothetical protein
MKGNAPIVVFAVFLPIEIGLTFVIAQLFKELFPKLHIAARYFIAFLIASAIFAFFLVGSA